MQNLNYITIQSWMVTELNLSGNELLVYAIIYGFSQDGESRFTGSRSYIAKWLGCTTRCVQNILNSLTESGTITKYERTINNIKHCEYVANFTTGEKNSLPSEKVSLNNTINSNITTISINRNNSNTEISDYEAHSYSKSERKEGLFATEKSVRKPKKKNLYEKCVDEIYIFTNEVPLQSILVEYLKFRLSVKDKPLYTVGQWKGLLTKLNKTEGDKFIVVTQSLTMGWLSFYPIKNNHNDNNATFGDNNNRITTEPTETTEEERIANLEKQGKRSKF